MQPTTIDTNIGRIRKAVALMAFGGSLAARRGLRRHR